MSLPPSVHTEGGKFYRKRKGKKMELDEKDKKIIREIMKNPKITDSELAEKIDLSRSGAAKRRKKLEENNEIQYYASPNLVKMSSKIIAGIFKFPMSVNREKTIEIAKEFAKKEEIANCWVRKVSSEKWGFSFLGISDKFKDKIEVDKTLDKWTRQIRRHSSQGTELDADEVNPYFIKMLKQNIKSKEKNQNLKDPS